MCFPQYFSGSFLIFIFLRITNDLCLKHGRLCGLELDAKNIVPNGFSYRQRPRRERRYLYLLHFLQNVLHRFTIGCRQAKVALFGFRLALVMGLVKHTAPEFVHPVLMLPLQI